MAKFFCAPEEGSGAAVPIWPLQRAALPSFLQEQPAPVRAWVSTAGFKARAGAVLQVPSFEGRDAGALGMVLLGLGAGEEPFASAALGRLPAGEYALAEGATCDAETFALGWALASYSFDRYRAARRESPRMRCPPSVDRAWVERIVDGVFLARDLINTPPNDMGPAQLAEAARSLAEREGAVVREVVGEALLEQNYPLIYAVGKGSEPARAPRLIDFCWGEADAPKVTLVGKGVCFDTGGLNLKPTSGMLLMKKDMGGAAGCLGLAQMVMQAQLSVRLRVLIPSVENSNSATAMRPSDVYKSRKGLTVVIGHTDAEGRLVLADALTGADEERPELLFDLATLTGAARVALGTELSPLMCDDVALARALLREGERVWDPLWRLPLYQPCSKRLDSRVADLNNIGDGSFAGAIIAGLFLKRFVQHTKSWAHLDIYGWNPKERLGRSAGGAAPGIRAIYSLLEARYG